MTVRTHRFKGVKYFLDFEPYEGWCDRAPTPDPKEYPAIRMPNGLDCGGSAKAKNDLWILLHECLHALDWSKSEEEVEQVSGDMMKLLWRLNYRRQRATNRQAHPSKESK